MIRSESAPRPGLGEATRFWLRVGFVSFGGPAGQIALLHEEVVSRRGWVTEDAFAHALNYCMLLPGPEAQQLATYIGWLLHGTRGALIAGSLFVLPSALILWLLAWAYVSVGIHPGFQQALDGLRGAVIALIVLAIVRIARKALRHWMHWVIAIGSLVALGVAKVPFPALILAAAVIGVVTHRVLPGAVNQPAAQAVPPMRGADRGWWRFACILVGGSLLWWAPVVLLASSLGSGQLWVNMGIFFGKAAMVTFGGAYAVLPFVGDHAVASNWVQPHQVMDAMAFAETTPGPLIMVVQFLGFLAGWSGSGPFVPLMNATIAAVLTTWMTFVPSFIWILLGAPHLETWGRQRLASAALSGVTAAVVGVICNLGIWFMSASVLPAGGPFNGKVAVIAVLAGLALAVWRIPAPWVVITAGCIAAGLP